MGTVIPALVKGAVDAIPKQDMGAIAAKAFKSLESGFRETQAGNDFADLLKNKYIPIYQQAREKLFTSASSLPTHMQPAPHELDSQARNIARVNTLGQNDYRGVGLIKAVEKEPGLSPLQIQMKQQSLADHVHMFLKDTVPSGTGPQSQFKRNVRFNKELPTKITTEAHYTTPSPTERFFTRAASKTMLPFIAIPHIGTLMNYAINTPLQDLAKGVADATFHNSNLRQQVADFGLFAGTVSDAYAVRHYGAKGIIARATGKDQFGVIVNQLTHQPGFNALREWTISIGAATGKHSVERMAEQLVSSGGTDKVAIYQLKKMGLNPTEVMLQKGQLNPDQYRKAIFNYVDNKVFLDNTMQRSYYSGASWYNRMGSMYHGYVSRQGALLKHALTTELTKNGPVGVAQTFAMLGIGFPAVGAGLKTLEMYGRGQFQEADPKEDYRKLSGAEGIKPALEEWLDAYSHMAAFGVATSYMRGAFRSRLANEMLGPVGNEGINLIQDTAALAASIYKDPSKPKYKPLARDVVEDTMPDNLGKLIAHQALPTAKEEKARNPSHKLKKLKGMKLKKLKSIN